MRSTPLLRTAYGVIAALFAACLLIQVFIAGLSIFANPGRWATHVLTGHLFGLLTVLLLILALLGRFPPARIGMTAALPLLYAGQYLSIEVARAMSTPVIAALHPVNALLMFALTITLGWWAFSSRTSMKGDRNAR